MAAGVRRLEVATIAFIGINPMILRSAPCAIALHITLVEDALLRTLDFASPQYVPGRAAIMVQLATDFLIEANQ